MSLVMIGSIYSFLFAYETMSLLRNYNPEEGFPRKLKLSGFTCFISTRCGDIYNIKLNNEYHPSAQTIQ